MINSVRGLSLCFTGGMRQYNRISVNAMAREHGARVSNKVHRGLDYLVVGHGGKNNSKYKEAKRLGVKTMSCDEFLELVA